ncbi:MAG: DUF4105 domain-containing protein [Myxococcota bacterium]
MLLAPALLALALWACAALWIDGPTSRPLAGLLVAGFSLGAGAALVRVRPLGRGLAAFGVLWLAVLGWWLWLEPSNDRDWEPSVARLPTAAFDGDLVTISNLRNFDYQTEQDFTERWEERTYDLSKLRGADIFLSYWGSPWIAHTVVSWEFDGGQHLAISIETRKQAHESYSALRGFFRQFELYYVVSDERDVIRLRTNYRGEDVYLYHLTTPADRARDVLLDYLREINELAEKPRWYNAATHNCTTAIRYHVQHVAPSNPWDWRILVNGRIDELGHERGTIDRSLPFAELRRRSAIGDRAQAADQDPQFSARIRAGLPGGRSAP